MKTKDSLVKSLDGEDDLGKVIRSQIVIENLINKFIDLNTSNYDCFEKMQLTFEQKTYLSVLLGLNKDYVKSIKCLGKLRNGFAHNLRDEINSSDANNFYKSFSINDKKVMNKSFDKMKEEITDEKFTTISELDPEFKFILCVTTLAAALDFIINNIKA